MFQLDTYVLLAEPAISLSSNSAPNLPPPLTSSGKIRQPPAVYHTSIIKRKHRGLNWECRMKPHIVARFQLFMSTGSFEASEMLTENFLTHRQWMIYLDVRYILKPNKLTVSIFQFQKRWRKKCVDFNDKSAQIQTCPNWHHQLVLSCKPTSHIS